MELIMKIERYVIAVPKVGTRGRQWHLLNELGGLVEEITCGKVTARKRAAELDKERKARFA